MKDGTFSGGVRPGSETPGSVKLGGWCRGTQWGVRVLTEKFPKDRYLYFVVSVFYARNQENTWLKERDMQKCLLGVG